MGAGTGRTINDLIQELDRLEVNVKVSATVLRKHSKLDKHLHSKRINWISVEFESLTSKIPPNSINFAYSNFGIRHAQNIKKALTEVHKILKPGGRIIFTHRAKIPYSMYGLIPQGFKPVRKNPLILSENINQDSVFQSTVIYLEKI